MPAHPIGSAFRVVERKGVLVLDHQKIVFVACVIRSPAGIPERQMNAD